MPEFPKTLQTITSRKPPRWINDAHSVTEILSLDAEGNKITKNTKGGWYGVYFWNEGHWELRGVFRTVPEAEREAAAIRARIILK
jgi:hypothetical protein